MRLDQVFGVPNDSHFDKIRGKFEDARLSLFMPKKVVTGKEATQRAVSCEKKRTEPPATVAGDKKEETPTQKDQPKTGKIKKEQSIQDEKPQVGEVTKESPAVQEMPIPEQKPRSSQVSDDKFEEYKNKAMAWKVRIEEEVEGWLDYGLVDGLLETMSKNKKAIAVAAAAFSAGFYISRKLRSSGR